MAEVGALCWSYPGSAEPRFFRLRETLQNLRLGRWLKTWETWTWVALESTSSLFFFFGRAHRVQKVPDWGSNLNHNSDLNHCSDERSIIHRATWKFLDPPYRWGYLRSPSQSGAKLKFEPDGCLILRLLSFHPSLVGKFYSSSLHPANVPAHLDPLKQSL